MRMRNRVEKRAVDWMARNGHGMLRISLGVVFFWFGAIKLLPGGGLPRISRTLPLPR